MKPIDFVLLALVAVIVFFAVRRMLRTRRSGGCGCGCPGCTGSAGCNSGGAGCNSGSAGCSGGKCPSDHKPHTGG